MHPRLHNRLPPWHRRAIYGLTGLLLGSGLAWLVVAYALAAPGEDTPAPHALAGPLLAAHGIAAQLALLSFGLVGQAHLRTGWRLPAMRTVAFGLGTALLALVITGLGFYYVASEAAMIWLRWTHVAAGAALPAVLALHIRRARRLARRG